MTGVPEPSVDRLRAWQKTLKIPSNERKNANCERLDQRETRNWNSLAAQRRDCRSANIERYTEASERKTLHLQDYHFPGIVFLIARKRRYRTHLWKYVDPLVNFTSKSSILSTTVWRTSHPKNSGTSQRISQSRRRSCKSRCNLARLIRSPPYQSFVSYSPSSGRTIKKDTIKALSDGGLTHLRCVRQLPHSMRAYVITFLQFRIRLEEKKACWRPTMYW